MCVFLFIIVDDDALYLLYYFVRAPREGMQPCWVNNVWGGLSVYIHAHKVKKDIMTRRTQNA